MDPPALSQTRSSSDVIVAAAQKRSPPQTLEEQVEEALQSLDSHLTRDYYRAKEVVPNLVRTETKVSDYLRTEYDDPIKAAARLARHWKTRKLFYGDRWL